MDLSEYLTDRVFYCPWTSEYNQRGNLRDTKQNTPTNKVHFTMKTTLRLLFDIIFGAALTVLSVKIITSLSSNNTQLADIEVHLNIYLFVLHFILLDNVFTVLFGHRSEHINLLRELEKRLSVPILAKQAIDHRSRNAFKLFERIGTLDEMKWFALKFIAFDSMRCFPNGTKAEIPLTKEHYSNLLTKLLKECSLSIEWVGVNSPVDIEKAGHRNHSMVLYDSKVTTKTRVFVLPTKKYNSLLNSSDSSKKAIMKKYLKKNAETHVNLFFAKKDEVKKAFPNFINDDFGIYDRCVVIQWTGGKKKRGQLIIGEEIQDFQTSIDIARNDATGTFHHLSYNASTDQIVRAE